VGSERLGVLESNVAYLLIRTDLVHRHADASEEQGPRQGDDACAVPALIGRFDAHCGETRTWHGHSFYDDNEPLPVGERRGLECHLHRDRECASTQNNTQREYSTQLDSDEQCAPY
jgi:hypothetical protein